MHIGIRTHTPSSDPGRWILPPARAFFGEPTTNHGLFELLERAGWLTPELRTEFARMAGFRNVLVHGYVAVDAAIVRDVLEHRLGDIESFVESIRRGLDGVSTA